MKESEPAVSLAEAISQILAARGLRHEEMARRLGDNRYRGPFYRLMTGRTTDPRLGTFIDVCLALEVTPTELVQLAGLWPHKDREPDALDSTLRAAFARLQALPTEDKRSAIRLVSGIAEGWRDDGEISLR